MKTKIILLAIFFITIKTKAQNQNTPPGNAMDYSSSQIGGFTCIGIGATAIILAASNSINPAPKNPCVYYIGGGVVAAVGICLLIFGNKENKEPKYWKGMGAGYIEKRKAYSSFCLSK